MSELTRGDGRGRWFGNAPLQMEENVRGERAAKFRVLQLRRPTLLRGREQRSLASWIDTIDMRGGAGGEREDGETEE